ncbi:hypothetical protein [Rivularia sp. UHCC 0363]|uniref:hypothetical protein n=1 Tax=Rivularia sp. UHCC 0363 TaxID=3110244 RepID=UPI002B201B81|nr:hypothetical protein [Rivularia sp. UHCC 0363]MEA5599119.1 hypothetical protein [Rivularia sp. UHCC 0363]
MKILNLAALEQPHLNEPEAPSGSYARLLPEDELDKKALTAFCCMTNDGNQWLSERHEAGSILILLDSLKFDDNGFATIRTGIQPCPSKFDPMTFLDQPTVEVTFWVELDSSGAPTGCWRATSEVLVGEQSNWLGYPIVF